MAHRFAPVLLLSLGASVGFAADGLWHSGSVEAAFTRAKAEQKPLFLYWGAVWCPPCNEVKKTIFSQPEFAESMKQFIPVYLDGDEENAQIWGEKLEIKGYPTMLVLGPEGDELLRLSTGVPLPEFLDVLDDALDRAIPLDQVADEALKGKVPRLTWRRLAYASWSTGRQDAKSPEERATLLAKLAAACPAEYRAEASRLWVAWLEAKLEAAKDDASPFESDEARRAAAARMTSILTQPETVAANLEFLSYGASDAIPALAPNDGEERRALVRAWQKAMASVASNPESTIGERLHALGARIDLDLLGRDPKAEVSRSLRKEVRREVARADREADAVYERQATMSTAAHMLLQIGQEAEARALLESEIKRSSSPYYFMSSLASIEREAGHADAAVTWMAKAYESSKGRATRFQWGVSYLNGLMDLAPDDLGRIRDESKRVLGELMSHDDAFAGRNQGRVKTLSGSFAKWNTGPGRLEVIEGIRGSLGTSCERWSGDPGDRCRTFFEKLGS